MRAFYVLVPALSAAVVLKLLLMPNLVIALVALALAGLGIQVTQPRKDRGER